MSLGLQLESIGQFDRCQSNKHQLQQIPAKLTMFRHGFRRVLSQLAAPQRLPAVLSSVKTCWFCSSCLADWLKVLAVAVSTEHFRSASHASHASHAACQVQREGTSAIPKIIFLSLPSVEQIQGESLLERTSATCATQILFGPPVTGRPIIIDTDPGTRRPGQFGVATSMHIHFVMTMSKSIQFVFKRSNQVAKFIRCS